MKTTTETAALLGLSRNRIIQACKSLGIPKVGRDYVLTADDIELIKKRKGKFGPRRRK